MSSTRKPPEELDAEGPSEADPDEPDDTGRLDRGEHRARMVDLKALANRLAKLSPGLRHRLPLGEELQHELDRLAEAPLISHRRRLVMRVKLLLGAEDLDRLEAVLGGDTAAALERSLQKWRARILAGDDTVIQQFIDAYPTADRQGLRTAAREARRVGPPPVPSLRRA